MSKDAMLGGSDARNALSMLIVRGIYQARQLPVCSRGTVVRTPLIPMHLKPTSRMNSTTVTASISGLDAELSWKRAVIDSGEFIVIVVAVMTASHNQRPSLLASASCPILLKTCRMLGGAGIVPGRASAALMTDLRAGDSFIVTCGDGQAVKSIWTSKRRECTFRSPPKPGPYLHSYRVEQRQG